jgi:hypothetical protein
MTKSGTDFRSLAALTVVSAALRLDSVVAKSTPAATAVAARVTERNEITERRNRFMSRTGT